MKCNYIDCNKELMRRYYYQHPYGYVCLLHDRMLGRNNMLAMGNTLMEALLFEDDVDRWEARERRKENVYKVDQENRRWKGLTK